MPNEMNKYKLLILMVLFIWGFNISYLGAQISENNALLVSHAMQQVEQSPAPTFMKPTGGIIQKINPFSWLLGGLMFTYQRYISAQLPSECLFDHHCSAFSKEIIGEFGLIKGIFLTSDRLSRCNRIGLMDVHPLDINPSTNRVAEDKEIYRVNKKRLFKPGSKPY